MKTGDVFYDYESTDFGLCGATFAPTEKPTKPIKNDGPTAAVASSSSGVGYRCVDKSLAERGYKISSDKCGLFDNCFNSQIKVSIRCNSLVDKRKDGSNYALINFFQVGDDWFCDESSSCIEADECADDGETVTNEAKGTRIPTLAPVRTSESPMEPLESNVTTPSVTRPPKVTATNPEPDSVSPTLVPTTSAPTLGPCDGEPCSQRNHCRSQYGFCGPNPTYCNELAIWTKDCPDEDLTPSLNESTESPTALSASGGTGGTSPPTKKFVKPGGGKGSIIKPARTHPPTEPHPYFTSTNSVNQPKPTNQPSPFPMSDPEPPSPYPISEESSTNNPTFDLDSNFPTVESILSSPWPSMRSQTTPIPTDETRYSTPAPSDLVQTPSPIQNSDELTSSPSTVDALVSAPPTEGASTKATNEFTCTGDRCPIDSQCRSRYGTCGAFSYNVCYLTKNVTLTINQSTVRAWLYLLQCL